MDTKKEILKKFQELDFYEPLTNEEFEDALDLLAQVLLFDTKWESIIHTTPKLRKKIPSLTDIPLYCKGQDCPYAKRCPILLNFKSAKDEIEIIGTDCRADKIFALEQFASFVRDLQIDPEQTTDIINVVSLVRILIIKRRIDWTISIDGIMDKEPKLIDQKTGQVHFTKVVHPLLKVAADLEKQQASLQKQLMADRQARAALASSLGQRGQDIMRDLFAGKLPAQSITVDAEFHDVDEEE